MNRPKDIMCKNISGKYMKEHYHSEDLLFSVLKDRKDLYVGHDVMHDPYSYSDIVRFILIEAHANPDEDW